MKPEPWPCTGTSGIGMPRKNSKNGSRPLPAALRVPAVVMFTTAGPYWRTIAAKSGSAATRAAGAAAGAASALPRSWR
ncbi:hypothetical protein D3C83_107110 [compost metagenome]